ncbi:response regulator [Paraburkholderia strydomiana]|uniref:response regulator n=1 Tax=Paraburkholderia strydomiana TaxID=1245417 RepID=UPI0038B6E46E
MAFESHGHHVLVAKNGRDALRKASSSPPELVVTDLQMPQMGGEELCYQLKRRSAFAASNPALCGARARVCCTLLGRVSAQAGRHRKASKHGRGIDSCSRCIRPRVRI